MASRKKIGLLFVYDERWAGGMYYLLNIVNALNFLPEHQKPELTIFWRTTDIKKSLSALNYPFLSFLPLKKKPSIPERVLIKLQKIFSGTSSYVPQYPKRIVDFVFPCDYNAHIFLNSLRKIRTIYWVPDFQHKHLPHFFDAEEIQRRDLNIARIATGNNKLVLSSNDSLNDFLKFFPGHNADVVVMPFAAVLQDFSHVKIENLLDKFRVAMPYFISPNQFWVHKNHIVILKAVALLKHKGYNYQLLFTGKEQDYRNPDYVTGLKKYIADNQIEKYIRFLGFIDREDQLQLMKHAMAVVQPSLFEGWSTVVEDSKAMDQTLILSSLNVHREQCGEKALYFDPGNEHELAEQLERCILEKTSFATNAYHQRIVDYALQIINL